VLVLAAVFAACGSTQAPGATQGPAGTAAGEIKPEAVSEPDAEDAPQESQGNDGENELPTISGLGIDQGNYSDDATGVKINIQSMAWGGTEKDVVMFTASKMYDTAFTAKMMYPEKIYEIHFGDGMWYQYDPKSDEIIDPWFDVDAEITGLTGRDAATFSGEFDSYIQSYCIEEFGYGPDELIVMNYE
jgi:hypothetical protein